MERVVMEEDEAPRTDSALEGDRVGHARVPPADFRLVLILGVLRVMHEQVDLLRDRTAGDPVERPVGESRECRLVIGQVRKARLGRLDPKADGWARMNDEVRGQSCSAD